MKKNSMRYLRPQSTQTLREGIAELRAAETTESDAAETFAQELKHDIDVVVDRIVVRDDIAARLADSFETALELADGEVWILPEDGEQQSFSRNLACTNCGLSFEELAPRHFSFNSPYGACPKARLSAGVNSLMRGDSPNTVTIPDISFTATGAGPVTVTLKSAVTTVLLSGAPVDLNCNVSGTPEQLIEVESFGTPVTTT